MERACRIERGGMERVGWSESDVECVAVSDGAERASTNDRPAQRRQQNRPRPTARKKNMDMGTRVSTCNKKVIKKQKDPRITQKRCQKVDER